MTGERRADGPPCDPPLEVLHVDMDCFFAAVEALDDESLRHRPVVVGGVGPRGVVASCSYEARAYGVRSAMPMSEARRRCPHAAAVPARHGRYFEVSRKLHGVFREITPTIEPISLDEAFLDVSGSHRLFGTSEEIAWLVRRRVLEELSLECSVGVARTKLVAKLASREAKPRASREGPVPGPGVVVVLAGEELAFLHPRPVRELWGVGPRTAEQLARYGVQTVGELAAVEPAALERLLGTAAGRQLHALSWGRDDRPVEPAVAPKSIGHEETFATDRHAHDELHADLVRMADSVGARLRTAGLCGRTVSVKVRFADFSTVLRSHSLPGSLLSSVEIARVAAALLGGIDVGPGARLLGVSVSSLEPIESSRGRQLSLLDLGDVELASEPGGGAPGGGAPGPPERTRASEPARAEVEAAVDAIRRRYGVGAVGPAAAIDAGAGLRVKELGDRPFG